MPSRLDEPGRPGGGRGPSRRDLLRLGGVGGLLGLLAPLTGCSAEQRAALLDVDPREVRLDTDDGPVPPRARPSEREQRRRGELAASLTAVAAYAAAGTALPALTGRAGGAAPVGPAVDVHRAHADLLRAGAKPIARSGLLPRPPTGEGGPVLPDGRRPAAVLRAGAASALQASLAERAEQDPDLALARLHARVASARAAQASALLAGPGTSEELVWPTRSTTDRVVGELQTLLAAGHRARWSYAVVLAWAGERAEDAEYARVDHTERTRALSELLTRLGSEPVRALATYPTDTDGVAVDGPVSAAALALRCEDAVAAASAAVLDATVDAAPTTDRASAEWVETAVTVLAEQERTRWSWGGTPAALPGG